MYCLEKGKTKKLRRSSTAEVTMIAVLVFAESFARISWYSSSPN